jgi:hypothetical protein
MQSLSRVKSRKELSFTAAPSWRQLQSDSLKIFMLFLKVDLYFHLVLELVLLVGHLH